jgi:heme/copper-type cytochrome/quinol oxidase subunit 2
VLLFLAESVVTSRFDSLTVGVVLLPVVYVTLVLMIRRYRRVRATAPDDVRASVAFTGAIRRFAVIWSIVLIVGLIVLTFLVSRAGP